MHLPCADDLEAGRPTRKAGAVAHLDVESLDTPVYRDNGEILRVDQIEGRVLTPQLDEGN